MALARGGMALARGGVALACVEYHVPFRMSAICAVARPTVAATPLPLKNLQRPAPLTLHRTAASVLASCHGFFLRRRDA
jgi:predicted cobalt transporter CbtA